MWSSINSAKIEASLTRLVCTRYLNYCITELEFWFVGCILSILKKSQLVWISETLNGSFLPANVGILQGAFMNMVLLALMNVLLLALDRFAGKVWMVLLLGFISCAKFRMVLMFPRMAITKSTKSAFVRLVSVLLLFSIRGRHTRFIEQVFPFFFALQHHIRVIR